MQTQESAVRLKRRGDLMAIVLVLLSSLLYTGGYGLSKSLVGTQGIPAVQVTFLRCALVLAASFGVALWPHSRLTWQRIAWPARAWEQRAAAFAVLISIYLSIFAYGVLPVTEASALGFIAPLLLTALAGIVLREHVSLRRWLAAGIGFVGMLLIIRPDTAFGSAGLAASLGIAASLGSALAYALYQILIRRLRDAATSMDGVIQVSVVGVVLLMGSAIASWQPISPAVFALVIASTVAQTAGLVCIVAALRLGEASGLAPWQFSGLLWAIILDAVMFATMPSLSSVFGSVLILAGGVLAHTRSPRTS